MSQFKSGDLALIIGSSGRRPELIGHTIQLIEMTECRGGPGWTWMDGALQEFTLEKHLMPLRGDFTPEKQKSQEVVE